jgi:hypothetical protein
MKMTIKGQTCPSAILHPNGSVDEQSITYATVFRNSPSFGLV